uniref:Uncharacterized protein n=1 Tax=Candidatus Methanogaster sp. ANME-2c ERB4 TaxID=2759911 RepID=A0A7G9Y1E3_9EURY|nr:hypothetical protein HNLGHHHH_00005 [Methanosarcinales archaeon ANME-2c ERB4]QNO42765.1 hypothetical protein JGNACFCI_00002 [Methanosarcinales archaeon ANME-2c ERB4]
MMKYLYQDSVKLPSKRDFIHDLETLLDVTAAVVPLEDEIISANNEVEECHRAKDRKITGLKTFESEVTMQLNELVRDGGTDEIQVCKNAIIEVCASCVDQQKAKVDSESDASLTDLAEKIDLDSERICKIISPFLEFGVYGARFAYSLESEGKKGLHGEFKADLGELSFAYELRFKDAIIVKHLVGPFAIPVPRKAGLFHSEDAVKMLDMSHHRLADVTYSNNQVTAEFKDRRGAKIVRIEMKPATNDYSIVYDGAEPVNLTRDESISQEIDSDGILGLMHAVIGYVLDTEKREVATLVRLTFNGMNVVREPLVTDALKVILAEYGRFANECIAHGAAKDEFVIKIESDDGTRTEKYMSISTVKDRLLGIGKAGAELADAFGLGTSAS